MTNPPTVKMPPTSRNTRTSIDPILTLDLSDEYIMAAPITMMTPLTSPIPPTMATAIPAKP